MVRFPSNFDDTESPTLVSLFAGAGGLDIGLEEAGFAAVAINELEPHACATLLENQALGGMAPTHFDEWFKRQMSQKCHLKAPQEQVMQLRERVRSGLNSHNLLRSARIIQRDVRELSGAELLETIGLGRGEVTLVAGGPPCQPFSRSGKRENVEVADGRLFLSFVRVVRELRPRWFLFENVKGLAQTLTEVTYATCVAGHTTVVPFDLRESDELRIKHEITCKTCGRQIDNVSRRGARGGSLEIILAEFESAGYTCYSQILNAADFGVPQTRERLFIVGSRDGERFKWPQATHASPIVAAAGGQLTLLRNAALADWVTVEDVLWQNGHPVFGLLDREKAVLWVRNVVRPHDEPVFWRLDRPSPTVGAHQGAKLALAPDGVPPEQLLRQQWHVLGRRQRDLPALNVRHALLSDEELLTLQTFPKFWYLHGTRMERAFQVGNAVPPLLARCVGRAILEACGVGRSIPLGEKAVG